jgi:hypothetical protein
LDWVGIRSLAFLWEERGGEGREGERGEAGRGRWGKNYWRCKKNGDVRCQGEGDTVYYTSERGNMEIIHSYLSMPVMKSG